MSSTQSLESKICALLRYHDNLQPGEAHYESDASSVSSALNSLLEGRDLDKSSAPLANAIWDSLIPSGMGASTKSMFMHLRRTRWRMLTAD